MAVVKDEKTSKRCISCGLVKELEQFPVVYRHEIGEQVKEIRSAICQSCRETDKSQKAIFLFNKFEIEEEGGRNQALDIDYLDHLLYELNKEEKIREREQEAKEWLNELIEEDKKALEAQNEKKSSIDENKQHASFLSRRNFSGTTTLPKELQNSSEHLPSSKEKTKSISDKPKRNTSRLFHEAVKSEVVHAAMKRFFAADSSSNTSTTPANEAAQTLAAQDKKIEQKTAPPEKTLSQKAETSPGSSTVNPNDPRVTKLKNEQFIGSVTMARLASEKLKSDERRESPSSKPENNSDKKSSTETVIRNTWRKR